MVKIRVNCGIRQSPPASVANNIDNFACELLTMTLGWIGFVLLIIISSPLIVRQRSKLAVAGCGSLGCHQTTQPY